MHLSSSSSSLEAPLVASKSTSFGKLRYKYTGKHSEGNRFITDTDLWTSISYQDILYLNKKSCRIASKNMEFPYNSVEFPQNPVEFKLFQYDVIKLRRAKGPYFMTYMSSLPFQREAKVIKALRFTNYDAKKQQIGERKAATSKGSLEDSGSRIDLAPPISFAPHLLLETWSLNVVL